MKNTFYIFLMIIVLSCGSEEQEIRSKSADKISNRTQTSEYLELKMQWASFIAAQALVESLAARNDFSSIIVNNNYTISLEDVLGEQSITPNFKSKFLILLNWYEVFLSQQLMPMPEHGVVPPSFNLVSGPYLDYIVRENCLEFYFPNQLMADPTIPISSTAHPLTTADSNTGYFRYWYYLNDIELEKIVRKTIINPAYLSIHDNIIVARPINESECNYSEYNVDDFTLFLGN